MFFCEEISLLASPSFPGEVETAITASNFMGIVCRGPGCVRLMSLKAVMEAPARPI